MSTIPLANGKTDNSKLSSVLAYINSKDNWRPGKTYAEKDVAGASNYDWANYGAWGGARKPSG